ncbi:MAG: GTP cyclohydrolase II, partial [Acidimicrobiia bacterium]|nr:GTP cyclohydrolase II [Acidimicrobiia bacterium]
MALSVDGVGARPLDVISVPLPTPYGEMLVQAFERPSGLVYLAVSRGDVRGHDVLARVHSECLTGDVLGSLRCDCGVQLRESLRAIAAEGRGVVVYATGHEGRGIGLINKLRAYLEQDAGADTLDANLNLGLEVDRRDYGDASDVLHELGVRSVRLLTNNPAKVAALRAAGIGVLAMEPLAVASHVRNVEYLRTKQERLGHVAPIGRQLEPASPAPPDPTVVLGEVTPKADRPHVVLKYAQTLDGRIATATGDSRWISGEGERTLSHALRAACDGVLVGVGTVLQDDPQLTVRMVPGASPVRFVLDSTLRTPPEAMVLQPDAATVVLTTERSPQRRREALRRRDVGVRVV